MAQPRDILDAPGPLPGEEPPAADHYAEDRHHERAACRAWPEFPWAPAEHMYDREYRAVMVPRDWFATCEVPDAVVYRVIGGVVYASLNGRPRLCCVDTGPSFEGAYIPSPSTSPRRGL